MKEICTIIQEFRGFIGGVEFNNKTFMWSVDWQLELIESRLEEKFGSDILKKYDPYYDNELIKELYFCLEKTYDKEYESFCLHEYEQEFASVIKDIFNNKEYATWIRSSNFADFLIKKIEELEKER